MNAILANAVGSWSFTDVIIGIVIVAAVIAVLYIALNEFGIKIPQWVIKIVVILVVAVVSVFAIKFLVSLL